MTVWREDVLGAGFECTDIDLEDDENGPVVATLVRSLPAKPPFWDRFFGNQRPFEQVDVLYVHGWSDYFFQRRLAKFWTDRGAHFYALDLRRYGRSLRPDQAPGYISHLSLYDEEIGHAIERIRETPGQARKLVLMGHSTGGLVLSLWADRHRGEADALVLNSPWLELQLSGAVRRALAPVVGLTAKRRPYEVALPQIDLGFYLQAQQTATDPDDLADLNIEWRPGHSPPILSGWLHAILEGHAAVEAGLDVGAPVCTLLSARSQFALSWRDEMLSADTVLEVDVIARASLKLGPSVTVERIDGALHDVFLSAPAVRDEAFARLERWARGWRYSG